MRTHQKRSLQFELLERRDTPSQIFASATAGHHKPPPQLHHHTQAFNAKGTATLTSPPVFNGSVVTLTSKAVVSITKFGHLKGPLTGSFDVNTPTAMVTATFASKSGALNVSFAVNGDASQENYTGTFAINGGTGLFAGATGQGSVTATLSLTNQSLTFRLTGTITTIKK